MYISIHLQQHESCNLEEILEIIPETPEQLRLID